jgi:hypothetical protein
VLVFLDMIPDKLFSQPDGLLGCKLDILEKQAMANGESGPTLIACHSRHFNEIGHAPVVLPHTLGHSAGPLLLRLPEPYHLGSRG